MMTETQRAALMAAEGAFRRYTHHHITKNDGEKAKANYALADMMAAALAEPEPAEVPFAYLPVNLPDVFTHNAGCTLWAGNPQNKTLSADNSMIAVYTRPQRREPLTDEQIMLGWQAELQKAVAAEREACAALCETLQAPDSCTGVERSLWDVATMACADAIRARGSQ